MNLVVRVFGALCMAKALELMPRLARVVEGPGTFALAVLMLASWLTAAQHVARGRGTPRDSGVLAGCVIALNVWSPTLVNQHLALIGWIAGILGLFPGEADRALLLRVQCSVVYGFGALAKVNPDFLSGDVLEATMAVRPGARWIGLDGAPDWWPTALAVAAVLAEAGLALALWFRHTRLPAAMAGVGFHVSLVALMAEGWASLLRLTIFGGLVVSLYPAFFAPVTPRTRD